MCYDDYPEHDKSGERILDRVATFLLIIISLVLPPLLAVWLSGADPSRYLDFPFFTAPASHEAFSWGVWWAMVIFVLGVLGPSLIYTWRFHITHEISQKSGNFPLWGKLAVLLLILIWVLAWNRFEWFSSLQLYTFTPLWLCYIVIVNAITFKRIGRCLLVNDPKYLLGLFILSSLFWWYYEYLNGYIRNWYYVGLTELSSTEYAIHSTLAYATVLPAVMSTLALLNTFPKLSRPYENFISVNITSPKSRVFAYYLCGCVILGFAATHPEQLFMFVWIAPLFIIVGVRYLLGQATVFSSLANGDWRPLILPAIAALICGFFWELWNAHSLAHWEYNIPYVEKFYLFEMPVIGYAGYLPFGLVCLAVAELVRGTETLFK